MCALLLLRCVSADLHVTSTIYKEDIARASMTTCESTIYDYDLISIPFGMCPICDSTISTITCVIDQSRIVESVSWHKLGRKCAGIHLQCPYTKKSYLFH